MPNPPRPRVRAVMPGTNPPPANTVPLANPSQKPRPLAMPDVRPISSMTESGMTDHDAAAWDRMVYGGGQAQPPAPLPPVRVAPASAGVRAPDVAAPPLRLKGGTRALNPRPNYSHLASPPPRPAPGEVDHPGPLGLPEGQGTRRDFWKEAGGRRPVMPTKLAPTDPTPVSHVPRRSLPSNLPSFREQLRASDAEFAEIGSPSATPGAPLRRPTPSGPANEARPARAREIGKSLSQLAWGLRTSDPAELAGAHEKLRGFLDAVGQRYSGPVGETSRALAGRLSWQQGMNPAAAESDLKAAMTIAQRFASTPDVPVTQSRMRKVWNLFKPALEGLVPDRGRVTLMSRGPGRRHLPDASGSLAELAGLSTDLPDHFAYLARRAAQAALAKVAMPGGGWPVEMDDDAEADALLDYLEDHHFDPWATAVLCAAAELTDDLSHALEAARAAARATSHLDVCGSCGRRDF